MVEMAIVLPLLLILVLGIIEMGRLYNAQVTMTHAAREGIRHYVIYEDYAEAQLRAQWAVSSTMAPPALGDIIISPDPCLPGEPTTMTIEYPVGLSIPFLGERVVTIVAEGVMRCGG